MRRSSWVAVQKTKGLLRIPSDDEAMPPCDCDCSDWLLTEDDERLLAENVQIVIVGNPVP